MNSSSTTIKVVLPQQSVDRLKALQEKTEADNIAEVIKNAIRIYEAMVDEAASEAEFFIKRKGSEIEPLKVFE